MDPVQEAVAAFDGFINAQLERRHQNPRLDLLLQKVEEIVKEFSDEHSDEAEPEQQVFGIDLVLELILNNLDSASLFSSRSVTKQWNKISTKILNSRGEAKIKVRNTCGSFVVTSGMYPKTGLKYLSYFISTHCSDSFPWTSFDIGGNSLTDEELQNFLSKHGWNIKHLVLGFCSVQLCQLKRLLVEQVPNLEDLSMSIGHFQECNLRLFSEPREELTGVLKNLKTLYFSWKPPKYLVTDLLRVCGRLERVTGKGPYTRIPGKIQPGISWNSTFKVRDTSAVSVSTYFLKRILESGRTDILKNLEIIFYTEEHDPKGKVKEFCTNLLQRNPKLSRLRICRGDDHFRRSRGNVYTNEEISIISNLLTSTAATLQVLYIPPLSFLQGIEIPKLFALKHLAFNNGDGPAFLPPAVFNVSETLPQLTTMTIKFPNLQGYKKDRNLVEKMQLFFQNLMDHSIRSVKNVELQFCDLHCPLVLPSVDFNIAFPNLTQLCLLSAFSDFANEAKPLWTLSKLKRLEISIQLNCRGNVYPAIDCGFTGFSKETCNQLFEATYEENSSGLNAVRESKSLLDMESLEFLTLEVLNFYDGGESDYVYSSRIITRVTGLFAFRMCPWIRINLCGRVCKDADTKERFVRALKPILPYVHNVAWKRFGED